MRFDQPTNENLFTQRDIAKAPAAAAAESCNGNGNGDGGEADGGRHAHDGPGLHPVHVQGIWDILGIYLITLNVAL